jgi:replicative DNA helicase
MKMKKALYQSIDLWEKSKYNDIYKVMGEAIKAGEESNIGHDYFDEKALEYRIALMKRTPIPTGLVHFDQILNGGLSRGELGVIVAPTGLGKSWLLAFIGSNAIINKFKIIHYTLELYDYQVGLRYDTIFTGIPQDQIPGMVDVVKKKLKKMDTNSSLQIKHYPTKKAGINTVRLHLDKLMQQGFIPDVIIIDYADLMRPSQKYDQKRFELEGIYEELRGLAGELNVPLWTASQSNRGSVDSEVISIAAISESFAKAAVADVIATFSRTPNDKVNNTGRLYVAKNRAGRDGIVIPIKMDLSSFKIETEKPYESYEELKSALAESGDTEEFKIHNKEVYEEFKKKKKEDEDISRSSKS